MQSSFVKHSSGSNFVHLYHRKNHSCSELQGCLQGKRHPAEALLSPRDEDREEAGQRRYGRRGADHVTPGPDSATRGGRGRGRARGGRADRRDSSYSDNRGDSGQGSAAQSSRRAQPSKPKATEIAWKLFAADAKVSAHTAALLYLECIIPCLLACLCSTGQTWKYTVTISQDIPDTASLIHEHHSQKAQESACCQVLSAVPFGFLPVQGSDEPVWRYVDPDGNVQGPFTAKDMHLWLEGNYLQMELPICGMVCGSVLSVAWHTLSSEVHSSIVLPVDICLKAFAASFLAGLALPGCTVHAQCPACCFSP